ncbi:MAG: hypothetical protein RIS38_1353 [Verrucomicrobiota bacterium]
MLRLIRRPAYPGELNHELVWPGVFLGGAVFAWGWFLTGLSLPSCVFMRLTGLPCLGCGGTRCARALVRLDWGQAFLFHPGFCLVVALAAAWTIHSAVFWLRRDALRLRFHVEPDRSRRLRLAFVAFLVAHWVWQCYYLTR